MKHKHTNRLHLMVLAMLLAFLAFVLPTRGYGQELVFKKYTELTPATVLQPSDIFPVVVDVNSAPLTRKASMSQVADLLNGGVLTHYLSRANHTGTQAWSTITSTPTTLSGYGIVDAQPLDADLTSIAGLITTSFGRGLLTETDASSLRSTLSLVPGTHVQAFDSDLAGIASLATTTFGRGLLTETDASSLRSTLSLVPGTNVQAFDSDLASIAALSTASFGRSVLTLADAAALRSLAEVVPGVNVQAYDADLDTFATNGSAFYLSRSNHNGTQAWSTLTGTPTTLSGYGIADAQALDADLTDLADGTLTGTKVQRQMSVDADASGLKLSGDSGTPGNSKYYGTNGAGTKGFYDLPEGGGSGVVHPGDEVAYVYPETGNDTTGDGTQAAPWATLQKAVDEGASVIMLGEGSAGNVSTSSALTLTITGLGRDVSSIGSITCTGGVANVTISDGSKWSFKVTGNVTLAPSATGTATGTLTVRKVYGDGISFWCLGSAGTTGQSGGNAGQLILEDCYGLNAYSNGGNGGDGDSGLSGGNGGNGGIVSLVRCFGFTNVNGAAGVGGADGGMGSGSAGTPGGVVSIYWSEINNAPSDFGSQIVHASLVGGTWTD